MKRGRKNGIGWVLSIEVTPNIFGETEAGAKKIVEHIVKRLAGTLEPEFMTPREVEEFFKISSAHQTVYRNRDINPLPHYQESQGGKVLYKKAEVLSFIEKMRKA